MKKVTLIAFCSGLFLFFVNAVFVLAAMPKQEFPWKAGVSRQTITPETAMWLAGYGHRDRPAEGKYHDLLAKALVLEDGHGNQVALVTADILGFPKKMSDRIRDRLYQKHGLTKAQIILNGTHTHSGPVLEEALYDIYPLDAEQLSRIKDYSDKLEDQVVELVTEAIANKVPVAIHSQNGVARFQVNRRNNVERDLVHQTELKGPNDYAVPVIKIENQKGEIMAIAFGYACHPTTLDHYFWSGDYPGYAQMELEEMYPGTVAMFFQGAAGDQNPMPRRTVALAKQFGKTLAAAVERVLGEDMRQLTPSIKVGYEEINLAFAPHFEETALTRMSEEETGYMQRWALRVLSESKAGKKQITEYPYPLQIWRLGEQVIFNMGGEVTVAYSNALKKTFGQDIFVMAYSNDVMGYIPSEIILQEGGYEGYSSQMVYGLPSPWAPGIEKNILVSFDKLAKELEVPVP